MKEGGRKGSGGREGGRIRGREIVREMGEGEKRPLHPLVLIRGQSYLILRSL